MSKDCSQMTEGVDFSVVCPAAIYASAELTLCNTNLDRLSQPAPFLSLNSTHRITGLRKSQRGLPNQPDFFSDRIPNLEQQCTTRGLCPPMGVAAVFQGGCSAGSAYMWQSSLGNVYPKPPPKQNISTHFSYSPRN